VLDGPRDERGLAEAAADDDVRRREVRQRVPAAAEEVHAHRLNVSAITVCALT
jgi:hypothetical protein